MPLPKVFPSGADEVEAHPSPAAGTRPRRGRPPVGGGWKAVPKLGRAASIRGLRGVVSGGPDASPGWPGAAPAASPGVLRGAAVEDDGAKAEESDPAAAPERLFGFFLGVQKETRPQAKPPLSDYR